MNLLHDPAGDFIVDDDGKGYQDLGEDDYWDEREGEEEGDEEVEAVQAAGAGSKKKKAPGKGVDDVPCGPCVHHVSPSLPSCMLGARNQWLKQWSISHTRVTVVSAIMHVALCLQVLLSCSPSAALRTLSSPPLDHSATTLRLILPPTQCAEAEKPGGSKKRSAAAADEGNGNIAKMFKTAAAAAAHRPSGGFKPSSMAGPGSGGGGESSEALLAEILGGLGGGGAPAGPAAPAAAASAMMFARKTAPAAAGVAGNPFAK